MKYSEFSIELEKLIHRFDRKYYPPEVLNLLFEDVKYLDILWLKKTVSFFLASHKPALLAEFKENSRIEKDRLRMVRSNDNGPKFSESMFDQDDINFLFALTKSIASNEIPERDKFVKTFNPVLSRVIAMKDKKTAKCLFKEVGDLYGIPYDGLPNSEVT